MRVTVTAARATAESSSQRRRGAQRGARQAAGVQGRRQGQRARVLRRRVPRGDGGGSTPNEERGGQGRARDRPARRELLRAVRRDGQAARRVGRRG